jgi:hypothetical protein
VAPAALMASATPATLCTGRFTFWPNWYGWHESVIKHKTAIFREVNQTKLPWAHHDAMEFPDGQIVLLTLLEAGQEATVLQLPARTPHQNIVMNSCRLMCFLAKLQGLPRDMKAVTAWEDRDAAWTDVASGIRSIAQGL